MTFRSFACTNARRLPGVLVRRLEHLVDLALEPDDHALPEIAALHRLVPSVVSWVYAGKMRLVPYPVN